MNDITVWKITCFSESLSIKEKNGRDDTATRACWLKTSPTEFAQLTLITPQGSKTPPHLQEVFKWCPPQKPKVKATVETVPKTRKEKGEKKPHWMEPWTWVRRQSWVQAQPHPSLAAISTSVFCWNWSEAGEFNTCLLKCGEDQIRQRSPSANQVAITHGISSNYLFIPF